MKTLDARKTFAELTNRFCNAGLTVESIIQAFVEDNPLDWRVYAEIIPNWFPKYPRKDTQPILVVRFRNEYLRHSLGPHQGFFWDMYPDDMITPGIAFKALIESPTPPGLWMQKTHCVEESNQ